MRDCVLIGGGIAALTAGVELAQRGVRVILVEEKPHFGGRAYSFIDSTTGDVLDNGQHLIMGCYTSFIHFLRQIGSEHKLERIERLHIPFLHIDGRKSVLQLPHLPHNLSLLIGLLRYDLITVKERISVINLMRKLKRFEQHEINELEIRSVYEWLTSLGQSQNVMRCLWEVICLATLNTRLKFASAKLFAIVLQEIFFGNASASSLLIPKVGLSDLYVHDAVSMIEKYGGTCIAHTGVKKILWQDSKACGVVLSDGTLIETSHIIVAVPPQKIQALFPVEWHIDPTISAISNLFSSEIDSYHIWSDEIITEEVMIGLIGTPLQWIFKKGKSKQNQWMYTVVISAVDSSLHVRDEYSTMICEEICKLFPKVKSSSVTRVKMIKERTATICSSPGAERYRPTTISPFENIFFAGDWTSTQLPATLESAVRSGYSAAAAVYSHIHEVSHVHQPFKQFS